VSRVPLPEEAARAILLIALHRRRHGVGPSWRALGRALGWPNSENYRRMRALARHGVRWRRGVPGSLAVTPEALAAAIASARRPKEQARRERQGREEAAR
jgi:hypothetical protein